MRMLRVDQDGPATGVPGYRFESLHQIANASPAAGKIRSLLCTGTFGISEGRPGRCKQHPKEQGRLRHVLPLPSAGEFQYYTLSAVGLNLGHICVKQRLQASRLGVAGVYKALRRR